MDGKAEYGDDDDCLAIRTVRTLNNFPSMVGYLPQTFKSSYNLYFNYRIHYFLVEIKDHVTRCWHFAIFS